MAQIPAELTADFFDGGRRFVLALMQGVGWLDGFLGRLLELLHHFPRVNKIDWR